MPARYYSEIYRVDENTALECFYLDTCPLIDEYRIDPKMAPHIVTQDVGRQLVWLDEALMASRAQWKFVIGHHPIYSAGFGHGNQPEMIHIILPILQKHKVPAYFCGHDHDLQYLKTGDVNLFLSGGGSAHNEVGTNEQSQFGASISGFALASLRAHELQVRFIDSKGELLHTALVARA